MSDTKPNNVFQNASPEMRKELFDILSNLRDDSGNFINSSSQSLLFQILNDLFSGVDEGIDLSNITPEQIKALQAALSVLLDEIALSKILGGDNEKIIELILHSLVNSVSKSEKKRREKEEHLVEEKKLKELKILLEKTIDYEKYKVTNPNKLAGETTLENVINNLNVGGSDLAKRHEGGELLNKSFVEKLGLEGKGGGGIGM